MTWLDEAKALPLLDVAEALGLEPAGRNSLTPCPACAAPQRGDADKRGPVGCSASDGWRCWRCGAQGGPLDLVAFAMFGGPLGKGDPRWADMRHELAHLGLLDGDPAKAPTEKRHSPKWAGFAGAPDPPPSGEVGAAWEACAPVRDDRAVALWVKRRWLDPAKVDGQNLLRALPRRGEVPAWMRFGGHRWNTAKSEWRAVVPMFDHRGELASLHARALSPVDPSEKAASPAGYSTRGLVMANPLAQALLRGFAEAVDAISAGADLRTRDGKIPCGIVIAEGVPDFLRAATTWTTRPFPAVFGVISGSWTPELAARIPDGAVVVLATDPDPAGDGYADRIAASLGDRCRILRWRADDDVAAVGLEAGTVTAYRRTA